MTKKLLIPVLAGLTFIALLVGGWFIFAAANSPIQPSTGAPSSPTVTKDGTSESTSPTPQPSESIEVTEEYVKKLTDTSDDFKDAEPVEFFSKEETQAALKVSYDYAQAALTNRYFLSGQWSKDGYDLKQIDSAFGQFFTKELRAEIDAWDDESNRASLHSEKILPVVFYVADNGSIAPSPYCSVEISDTDEVPSEGLIPEEGIMCPMDAVSFSDMKYEATKDGPDGGVDGIKVSFTAKVDIPVTIIEGKKDAVTKVSYEYILVLVPNTNQDDKINPNKFLISKYDIKVLAGKVEPLNE